MNQMRYFSLKLNDGHFMPALGFGTSAPHKVNTQLQDGALKRVLMRITLGVDKFLT